MDAETADHIKTLVNCLPLLIWPLIVFWLFRSGLVAFPPPVQISCPLCYTLTNRGKRPIWQTACSILLFPFGLLTLLAGRNPTVCANCGHTWMA